MKRRGWFFGLAPWILAGGCALVAAAAEPAKKPPAWLVGKQFEQQLQRSVDLTWANAPLTAALNRLAANHRLAIVLDRRIDPDQTLSLAVAGQTLEEALGRIAETEHVGLSLWEPIVYLGPPDEAAALRTLAWLRRDEAGALPPVRRQAFLALRAWQWDDLATPRDLLAALAAEARVKIDDLDRVPHDLWPARRLPPLAWTDRLTLLAIEFGLTFEIAADGRSVRLVPIPDKVMARRSYSAGRDPRQMAGVLAQRYPEAVVRVEGDQIVVDGRIEDLEAVARGVVATARPTRKTAAAGKQVYTLSVEQPVDDLLRQLSKLLDVEFQLDRPAIERAGISLDRLVTVKVEGATLDELLAAVLEPAGLKGTRQGRTVTVSPRAAAAPKP
ncbi:MAG TPA: STN domain-containing protein [Pirellulales bacterium]|nr:STN domain-containing protein [Pirellulales bacterium]